jgi:hypothetical protein
MDPLEKADLSQFANNDLLHKFGISRKLYSIFCLFSQRQPASGLFVSPSKECYTRYPTYCGFLQILLIFLKSEHNGVICFEKCHNVVTILYKFQLRKDVVHVRYEHRTERFFSFLTMKSCYPRV